MPVILVTQEAEIQGNHGLKPALAKSFTRPYLKKIHHTHKKNAGGVAQVVE
jgi:hypothetical protein